VAKSAQIAAQLTKNGENSMSMNWAKLARELCSFSHNLCVMVFFLFSFGVSSLVNVKESELEGVVVSLILVAVLHQLDILNKECLVHAKWEKCYSHAISILGVKVTCCIIPMILIESTIIINHRHSIKNILRTSN